MHDTISESWKFVSRPELFCEHSYYPKFCEITMDIWKWIFTIHKNVVPFWFHKKSVGEGTFGTT